MKKKRKKEKKKRNLYQRELDEVNRNMRKWEKKNAYKFSV